MEIDGNAKLIGRAVFGHLAAQGVDRFSEAEPWLELRDWFLDTELKFPEGIRIYYWVYPHHGCVIFRDAAIADIRIQKTAAIWLLKFYPLSFMISREKTESQMFNLPILPVNNDGVTQLPIQIRGIPHRYWPEAPTDDTIIAYGQEAMFSVSHEAGKK